MVVVAVWSCVSVIFISRVRVGCILMMVMMGVGLWALRATSRGAATRAVFIGLSFIILGLSALAASRRLRRGLWCLLGGVVFVTSCRGRVGVC